MQDTTRSLARDAVGRAAAEYAPGANVAPFTDCVINNATTSELLSLARAAGDGVNGAPRAWPVVREVIGRREATQCLVNALSTNQLLGLGGMLL